VITMNRHHGTDMPEPSSIRIRVWDLPTRLFHWALVVLVTLQFASGEFELLSMQWHFLLGYATLALVAFRVAWGFVGSDSARFAHFLRGPRTILAYLGGRHAGPAGHNPLGGWSVVAMLACVGVQAVTGLMSSDDIIEFGPLTGRVSDATVDLMTRLHHWNRYVLLALIALHLAAVALHWAWRNDNLVAPMLHGKRRSNGAPAPPGFVSAWRALALLVASVALTWALVAWGSAA
jgi:cytochrome b